jgi:hypothetical protein
MYLSASIGPWDMLWVFLSCMHLARGWATTHGFPLQMGGLMLHDGGDALRPLQTEKLEDMHTKGQIEWPQMTESEIRDRSKGDTLSEGIVILQTFWFLGQYIVRGATGLTITELEIMTLALASFNVLTYFF